MLRSNAVLFARRNCSIQTRSIQQSVEANNNFLLTLLVCPLSKEPLKYDAKNDRLISAAAGIAFPMIRQGQINMILHEATLLTAEEIKEFS
mmetsp:Transcript_2304/g.2416  ORF Transcript_2304/g.2416 Transcript_2304/m.2416 type:complete len:91 (+) Transcript_2304:226-498(+)